MEGCFRIIICYKRISSTAFPDFLLPVIVGACVMRILALVGSYRKHGNTARIVRMVEASMSNLAKQRGTTLEFETLFLDDFHIISCRGCRACFDHGEDACPLKDDVVQIRARIEAADALILASPVYVDDVGGLMKNLLDRLAYLCHRPALGGKYACALATVGGGATNHTLHTLYVALLTWGCHILGTTGIKMGALVPEDELPRYQVDADKVAAALFGAVGQRRNLKPPLISLMAFRIQQLAWQRESAGSYDYEYWREHGWLSDDSMYYRTHRANPVTVMLARLAGEIVGRFVL
jgi:multimeric flavodoxin WrbA